MTPEKIVKRYEQLKSERASLEAQWEDIAGLVMPARAGFNRKVSRGEKRTSRLYDATAIQANAILAASMHGNLTPASSPWFTLEFRDSIAEDQDMEWLQDSVQRTFTALAESNFNSEINEVYLDLGAFGTAALLMETVDDALRFRAVPLSELLIAEDATGMVDTVFRRHTMTAVQIMQRWPEVQDSRVKDAAINKPDQPFDIVHGIYPREGARVKPGTKAQAADRPIEECFVLRDAMEVLARGGYYEMPYLVPRWGKLSGDIYGFSPAMVAYPDIATLNEARRLTMIAWEKAIDPPILSEQAGILGDLRLTPGGLTYVRDVSQIRPLESAARFDVTAVQTEALQRSVRSAFYADQLQIKESPTMTATEVQVRYEIMQRLLGPTLGRLQAELLNPLVLRVFYTLARAGRFAPPPDTIQATALDVRYVSPLARAQRMDEITALQRFTEGVGQLAQFDPSVVSIIDPEKSVRLLADRLGVPAEALRSEKEMAELREQQAAAQQQQAQMAQMQQGVGMAKDASQAMGSLPPEMMQQLMGAMGGEAGIDPAMMGAENA